MWIRRLKVAHCAGIADASVDLAPGLNVLHGPNELGKSSLVEAVRAVLLVQSGSSVAKVLDDWHSEGPPEVELTFEQDRRVWRVRKTFRQGGGKALLGFSRDGRDFSVDSRGREVDGRLNEMLGWGVLPPGGRGGPRGMPSTLITTALLGRQEEVVAILDSSLAEDPTESGREQLKSALEALSEDPRLKSLLDAVSSKVDEAYTATGRRRSGRTSPWTALKEERLEAEREQQRVGSLAEESESVRARVTDLLLEQAVAEEFLETARRDLGEAQDMAARRDELENAVEALRVADEELMRLGDMVRRRDASLASVAAARGEVDELSSQLSELERSVEGLGGPLAAARDRVREAEAGGGEQERRLREQDAGNRLAGVRLEQEALDRRLAEAERFAELDRRVDEQARVIEARERTGAEARELVEAAGAAIEADRRRLRELRLELQGARFVSARERAERRAREHEEARNHASAAAVLGEEAASLRKRALDLRAPSREEIERLGELSTKERIAREKLAVGLVLDLELEAGVAADVRVDGAADAVRVGEGRHGGIEARRELRVDIPGVGLVQVSGGGRELTTAAWAAERELDEFRRPLLERAGVAEDSDLGELYREAERLREEATEKERSAAEALVRAEGLEHLERAEALARGDLERSRAALAEAVGNARVDEDRRVRASDQGLGEGATMQSASAGRDGRDGGEDRRAETPGEGAPVDADGREARVAERLVDRLAEALDEGASLAGRRRGLDARWREESVIVDEVESVERRVSERREQSRALESKLERDDADLARDRRERADLRDRLARADLDWKGVLEGATEQRAELGRRKAEAESQLAAVRAEAAGRVEEARESLATIEREALAATRQRNETARSLAARREELAGLLSQSRLHEEALEREDADAARAEREERREIALRLWRDLAGAAGRDVEAPELIAGAAEGTAERQLQGGRPVRVGGDSADEQANEARERVEALRKALAEWPAPDVEPLERDASAAAANLSRITASLQKERGALEQVGGDSVDQQANEAKERVQAALEREASLEVEYEAWKLLKETLREVEKQETAHLGKALVAPVSSRILELTGGRYGDLVLGPELNASGIRFGGVERKFAELSVGTREQIALLLRISIAEALGAFLVLDDQLTQTDERRMAWLRELLEEAAARIQIVVLTCHPHDYGASRDTHVVDLTTRIRRSETGA